MQDNSIYRSVTITLQNETRSDLMLIGYTAEQGEWENELDYGDVVASQSSVTWRIVSRDFAAGVFGNIRLQSDYGIISISVRQPWEGDFYHEIALPEGSVGETSIDKENPAHPKMLVQILMP